MITVWLLIVVLANGSTWALNVHMATCMDAPLAIRAGDRPAARMSDGSLVQIVAAVCMGPAETQPSEGAGS